MFEPPDQPDLLSSGSARRLEDFAQVWNGLAGPRRGEQVNRQPPSWMDGGVGCHLLNVLPRYFT